MKPFYRLIFASLLAFFVLAAPFMVYGEDKPYVVIDLSKVNASEIDGKLSKDWAVIVDKDDFTEQSRWTVFQSKPSPPTSSLKFPYSDSKVRLVYGCAPGIEILGFQFTKTTLTGGRFSNGEMIFRYRVKWDRSIENHNFRYSMDTDNLTFMGSVQPLIDKFMKTSELTLEVEWYAQGLVRFKMDISGFGESVAAARKMCKGDK